MYYRVEIAADGRAALALAQQFEYDLLILDISLPEVDGIQVCQQLRAQGYQLPILLLTAKDGAGDRIVGLDAGADDYMAKPFYLPELLARIRALLRRRQTPIASIVTWENLRLDYLSQEVRYGEQRLRLTPKEYGILELLLLNPQRIFSRAVMIDRLWELEEPPTESAISSHIKAIRQKLKAAGATQDLIETVYGFGYRLRPLEVRPLTASPLADSVKGIQPEQPAPPTALDPSEVESSDRVPTAATIMAELWERFKDSFKIQLDFLEAVTLALQENTVTADLWQEAKQTVHKLVGSLGMYGFPQGSVVAKQIETLLRLDRPLESAEIQQLTLWIAALRQELSHPPTLALASPPSPAQLPLVLVVDDDEVLTARLQVEASLRSLRLTTAPNPIAAQALLDRTCPDVILLDLSFAEGNQDGLKWLENLKQQHPTIPVLVFTHRDSLSDRLAVSRLGARQFLHKPATPEQIFQAVVRVLSNVQELEAKVLMVDDDPAVLSLLSEMLAPWGLDLVRLSEPQRFWEVLVATSPDLIILDLEMPQVNGLELCRVVRQDSQWGDLPILVVTAHTDVESLQQAFAAGADDFITKPVMGPELVTRVLSRIERTRLQQRSGKPHQISRENHEP